MSRLSITFCGLQFENPFILAASPCTDRLKMVSNAFRAGWAGAVLKTTHSDKFRFDPVSPILWGYDFEDKKMVGLGNIDVLSKYHVGVVEGRVRQLKREFPGKVVIASVTGSDRRTWQEPIIRLIEAGADAIECSCSCPQGHIGLAPGKSLLENHEATHQMVQWAKEAAGSTPVFVKLSAYVDQIASARLIRSAGGDAVNVRGQAKAIMGVDLDMWVPYPSVGGKSTFAGYTGPATKPILLRNLAEIATKVGIPMMATGGITTWVDALETMLLGATIVQICTAAMHKGDGIIDSLNNGCRKYLEEKRIPNIAMITGKALANIVGQDELSRRDRVIPSIDRNLCVKDDICYISCRDGGHMAIKLGEDRIPVVDEEKCTGCGLCLAVCPVLSCITLKSARTESGL